MRVTLAQAVLFIDLVVDLGAPLSPMRPQQVGEGIFWLRNLAGALTFQ